MIKASTYPAVTEELLEEVVRRIRSVGSPRKIVLFGSRARGERQGG
jgi:predicted nucleotidyltransferase